MPHNTSKFHRLIPSRLYIDRMLGATRPETDEEYGRRVYEEEKRKDELFRAIQRRDLKAVVRLSRGGQRS